MRSPETEIQNRDTGSIRKTETDDDKKLMLSTDLRAIFGSAVAGLSVLIALSFWLVVGRIPFIVGAALPLLTLIAIAYQAVVYHRQWRVMQDNLDRTDRVIDKMQEQIDASDKALRASQRAYVGIKQTPKLKLRLNEFPEIEVYFVNTGRTPAHVVEFMYKFSSDKGSFGRTFIDYKGVKKDFFIFAETPKMVPCRWNQQAMDEEWLQQIQDRSSTIYFTGRLSYEGVWGVSDDFKTDDVIRFEYFSFGVHELRERYQGDQDYVWADPIVEFDGTEEEISSEDWEPQEPPDDYEPYNPYDF